MKSSRAAFTLVELLLVIGLIGLLSGLAGVALSAGNSTSSLQAAQDAVSGLLTSARTQAALSRARSRLLIYSASPANTDPEKMLRFLQVVVEGASGGTWRAAGEGVYLPKTAYIVPTISPATLPGETWGSAPVSALSGETMVTVTAGAHLESAFYYFVEFTATGTTTLATFVIAPAIAQPPGSALKVLFTNPGNVRGIKLSQYGVQTRLPHVAAF